MCLPHGYEYPQAPSNTHEYSFAEIGDDNASLMTTGKPMVDTFNNLLDSPSIETGPLAPIL